MLIRFVSIVFTLVLWLYGISLTFVAPKKSAFKARPNRKIIFKIPCSVRTPATLMFVLIDLNLKLCFRNVYQFFWACLCMLNYVHGSCERRVKKYGVITSSNFISYLKLLFLTHFGQWSYFVPPENPRFSEGIKWKHWSVMSSCF